MSSTNTNIFKRITEELVDKAIEVAENHIKGFMPEHYDVCELNCFVIFNHIDNDIGIIKSLKPDAIQNLIDQHNRIIYYDSEQ